MLTDILDDIKYGYNKALNNPRSELSMGKPIKPKDHPNKTLQVIGLPQFTVERKVMDVTKGDKGMCKFAIGADSAREAKHVGDAYQAAMNEVFEKGAQRAKKEVNEIAREAIAAIVNQKD